MKKRSQLSIRAETLRERERERERVERMSRVIQHHPAALRNRVPIAEMLMKIMKSVKGRAIEFGSGTGAHLEYFAPRLPELTFLPSERKPQKRFSLMYTLSFETHTHTQMLYQSPQQKSRTISKVTSRSVLLVRSITY